MTAQKRARQTEAGNLLPPGLLVRFCAVSLSEEDKQMNIEMVADKIMELKRREEIAKTERAMLEEQLAKEISDRVEGTASLTAGNYKVTVTSKLTRTLDYPAYQAIENDIPEGVRCVRFKPELDLKKLRAMDAVRSGFSAAFITTKPARPSVKVELVEG